MVYELPEDNTEAAKHVGVVKYHTFMYVCNLSIDLVIYTNSYDKTK